NAITKMQSQIDATTARIDKAEQHISGIEDKIMENNEAVKRIGGKGKDYHKEIRELSDLLKRSNTSIIRVPEDEEREKRTEYLCEQIITENFPNLEKDTDVKIQEAQRTPIRFKKKKTPS
ncbi:LORF1 protein, partial [Crocuta crocuta]